MAILQPKNELEDFYGNVDPWGYETNPDDASRLSTILSEIPERDYKRAIDIGCGEGFLTRHLPSKEIWGVDISQNAIERAREMEQNSKCNFAHSGLFELPSSVDGEFDLILITGLIYPQYFASSHTLIYETVDALLEPGGILLTSHIDAWYTARFPYHLKSYHFFPYREHTQRLEVYVK